jgi:hypothetical protein
MLPCSVLNGVVEFPSRAERTHGFLISVCRDLFLLFWDTDLMPDTRQMRPKSRTTLPN